MNILFTTGEGSTKQIYFPPFTLQALERLGTVTYNPHARALTPHELASSIADVEVCLTHWGCPTFTEEVLSRADRLKLIAHAAGSVANLVTPLVYERGIKVCSANTIMAKAVAEGVLAYILCGLRWIPQQAYDLQHKKLWRPRVVAAKSLHGAKISLVGLGTIGRFLLDLLKPFNVQVKVYDPYVSPASLSEFPNVTLASLEEVLAWGEIVSIHASLTTETRGMLNANRLALIRDGALFVNTARGAIVDEQALAHELKSGRLYGVLDVYTREPLPPDSPLYDLENVTLQPHTAGCTAREAMSVVMIEEIARFQKGEPLLYEIPYAKYILMTKE